MARRRKQVDPNKSYTQTPTEELDYLLEIHGDGNYSKVFDVLVKQFDVLQSRAQLLLGLVTISLTITGFSGPRIAASSLFSKISIVYGLAFILISAVMILRGPLQLRWGTRRCMDTIHDSLVHLIVRRNERTKKYHVASACLIIGLTGYVGSVIGFLFQV
ncbi:MAG: hypothetical protein OES47_08875 [Acidobacteriota bacterium]|nr:hypothetical protein [Acidobacteriota bacterium]